MVYKIAKRITYDFDLLKKDDEVYKLLATVEEEIERVEMGT